MPRIKTQFSGTTHVPDKETNTSPSQTVPGMAVSIGEMLNRTMRGLPISSGAIPVYNGERLLPNWQKLDLIDRANVIAQAKADVEINRKRVAHQQQKIQEQIIIKKNEREKAQKEAQAAQKTTA